MCRTSIALSVAGAKVTRLARVGVSTRIVGCHEAFPRSRRVSPGGLRRWGVTMLPGRVCSVAITAATVVATVTVYLALVLVVLL